MPFIKNQLQQRHRRHQRGFTFVEIVVIAPIVILSITAFISAIVGMTGDVIATRSTTLLAYNVQDALNRIEQDVKLSTTFLAQNNITLTSPQGYDDATGVFNNVSNSTDGTKLILNTLATTDNPVKPTGSVSYLSGKPNACGANQTKNTPMSLNVVYFIKGTTLWRRVIMPSDYATTGCNTVGSATPAIVAPWQVPTCTPGFNPAGFCKTQDTRLVDGVNPSDFSVQYLKTSDATIASTVASDPNSLPAARNTALQAATTVSVSMTASQAVAGRTVTESGSMRATRLDINASTIGTSAPVVTPSAPTGVSATLNNPSNITVKWYANATSYNLQYDSTSAFSSPTSVNGISGNSQTLTNLKAYPRYYFRVQAINSAGTSGWSSTVSQWSTIGVGLVAWWQFNNDTSDSSGATASLSNIGSTPLTPGQGGVANTAYSFNGSSQYMLASSTFSLSTANVTLSAWVNSTSASASGVFIKVGGLNGSGNGAGYGIGMGGAAFDNNTPGTNVVMLFENVRWIPTTTALGTGWHHVAMTIDGSGTPYGYLDGALIGSYPGTAPQAPTNNTTTVGSSINAGTGRFFNGKIDDARIYNRALSSTEIQQLYADGAR